MRGMLQRLSKSQIYPSTRVSGKGECNAWHVMSSLRMVLDMGNELPLLQELILTSPSFLVSFGSVRSAYTSFTSAAPFFLHTSATCTAHFPVSVVL